jgi:hypothetical protein
MYTGEFILKIGAEDRIKGLSFWQHDSQPTLHGIPVVYVSNGHHAW